MQKMAKTNVTFWHYYPLDTQATSLKAMSNPMVLALAEKSRYL